MSDFSKILRDELTPYIEDGKVAGVVALVSDKDGVLAETAIGYADIANKQPMAADSMFWIASQSKPITATAVMMLVDEGGIELDAPVEQYLPEFADTWVIEERGDLKMSLVRPEHPITVRDLLRHTSGMSFASKSEAPTLDRLPLQNAVRSYAATPFETQPGVKYAYSNAGINTAARILEVVSGMMYEDFLAARLFNPLSMDETTFWPNPEQISRIAKVYGANSDDTALIEFPISQLTYPLNDASRYPMPAGGLFSTALDVNKFCRMILNGGISNGSRLLSERAVQEMTKRQTSEDLESSYGLGWGVGEDCFGHGGACATSMTIFPKQGRIAHFLVQHVSYVGGECGIHDHFEKLAIS